jgi:acyl transferase domain-containing protein
LHFPPDRTFGSGSAAKYWRMIASGGDAVTVVPLDRWDIDLNTSSMELHRRRDPETEAYSRYGRGDPVIHNNHSARR